MGARGLVGQQTGCEHALPNFRPPAPDTQLPTFNIKKRFTKK